MHKCIFHKKQPKYRHTSIFIHLKKMKIPRRKKWLKSFMLDDYLISNWHRICRNHFTISDNKQGSAYKQILWPESVPKQHPNNLLEIESSLDLCWTRIHEGIQMYLKAFQLPGESPLI
ncbi:uncharacterized protein LOC107882783 [Acyrthosiphon pisum]|uniref:THAP-type domain-containing protein n=1 Tax=Acyrthosiphon pisum TaxID=7029 RepID=A0A8R2D1U3_ACYPI|nr:uncharacterized protein LOC107882783 [Acyrthosiphon pisum]|eukprot:XP_016657176.1 PREDICTED: uncharacterized protein LOC107882783 [Acyrthosiphon pisum]